MRFGYRFTVDRHAFQARDDKARVGKIRESDRSPRQCHCEEDDRLTRQSIVSRGTRTESWPFAYRFTVDRHAFQARDDIFMEKNEKTKENDPKIRLLCYMYSGT